VLSNSSFEIFGFNVTRLYENDIVSMKSNYKFNSDLIYITGKLNANVEPFSCALFLAQIFPPCASIMLFEIYNPKPVPVVFVIDNELVQNFEKSLGIITKMGRLVAGGMRPDLGSLEDKEGSSKLYVQFALMSEMRKDFDDIFGKAIYSFTEREFQANISDNSYRY
jgi:hypothetical protein